MTSSSVSTDSAPSTSERAGMSVGRPDQDRRRADHPQRRNERAGDARVRDVADDADRQPLEVSETLAHRVQVEQRLRGVLVHPVAAVDDVRVHVPGEHPRRARRTCVG